MSENRENYRHAGSTLDDLLELDTADGAVDWDDGSAKSEGWKKIVTQASRRRKHVLKALPVIGTAKNIWTVGAFTVAITAGATWQQATATELFPGEVSPDALSQLTDGQASFKFQNPWSAGSDYDKVEAADGLFLYLGMKNYTFKPASGGVVTGVTPNSFRKIEATDEPFIVEVQWKSDKFSKDFWTQKFDLREGLSLFPSPPKVGEPVADVWARRVTPPS